MCVSVHAGEPLALQVPALPARTMDYKLSQKLPPCAVINPYSRLPRTILMIPLLDPAARKRNLGDHTSLLLPVWNYPRSSSGRSPPFRSLTFPLSHHLVPSNPSRDQGARVATTVLVRGVCSTARLAMLRSITRTAARDAPTASIVPLVSSWICPEMVGIWWTCSLRGCQTHRSTVKRNWMQEYCVPTNARQRGQTETASYPGHPISVAGEALKPVAVVDVTAVARHRDVDRILGPYCLFSRRRST